jgi:hypothetical protein
MRVKRIGFAVCIFFSGLIALNAQGLDPSTMTPAWVPEKQIAAAQSTSSAPMAQNAANMDNRRI